LSPTSAAGCRARRLAAAAALLLAAACGGAGGAGSLRGVVEEPPARLPSAILTDTSGAPYDLRAGTARLTFLVFGYTSCPDVCPTNMATLAAALRGVPAGVRRRVRVVFVTVDPARDTPAVLRAWLDRFDPTFVGLRGSPEQVHAAEREAGLPESVVEPAGAGDAASVAHAAQVLAYTADGLAHVSYLEGHTAADIRHDIGILLRGWPPRGSR
jgi:protein SCO1/2